MRDTQKHGGAGKKTVQKHHPLPTVGVLANRHGALVDCPWCSEVQGSFAVEGLSLKCGYCVMQPETADY